MSQADAPRLQASEVALDPAISGQNTVQDALGAITTPGELVTAPPSSHTAIGTFGQVAFGTPLQNTLGYDILVTGSVTVTAATAGAINLGVGPTSTPTVDPITPAITVAAEIVVPFSAVVPAGYYLSLTHTGTITVGTPTSTATPL